ncbi:Rho/RAC guanine nucleotide exchange factor [Entamoeba marina]
MAQTTNTLPFTPPRKGSVPKPYVRSIISPRSQITHSELSLSHESPFPNDNSTTGVCRSPSVDSNNNQQQCPVTISSVKAGLLSPRFSNSKLHQTKVPRSPRTSYSQQELFYPPGTLIKSGDVIHVHLKKFRNDSITSDKKETDEEGLDIMKNVYLIPINKCVSKQEEPFMRDVLTQVDIIIHVHQNFLEMFENGLKDSKEGELPMLGKEFIGSLQFLKMASQYIGNYDNYMKNLNEITAKDSSIGKAIKKAKEKYVAEKKDENLTVESIQPLSFYLITPIQRIPRYELLIRDMLRDVGKDFPDLESLKKAYLDAKESAKGVNQAKMQLEENEKHSVVREIIKGKLNIEAAVYRKFICSGPLYVVEDVNTPTTKQTYLFLFNDILLETIPSKHAGKPIETFEELFVSFEKLRNIKSINDLKEWEFNLTRELPFTHGPCVFKPIEATNEVKNIFALFLREFKTIREISKAFPTFVKYSAVDEDEKEAWKSIIQDQLLFVDEQAEHNERVKKSRKDIVTSELSRIEHLRQRSNSTLSFSSGSAFSTPVSEGDTTSHGTFETRSSFSKQPTLTSGSSTPHGSSQRQVFSIKYNADAVGNLVTSGNVISAITKKLIESGDSKKDNNDDEFFKTIGERVMDDKGKEHYKRVVHEMTETERIHLRGLEILKQTYLFPITKSSNPESVSFVKGIISQIDIIIGVHTKFLNMLEVDIVKLQTKAKQEYLKTHEGAKIELISFYLITPIQRIPRYELLIRDMLRDVGKDFPDLESLKKAYLDAKESAKGVNQTRMKLEENEKMDTIQNIIQHMPTLKSASSRRFISCGPLFLVENMNDFPTQIVFLFLFNDMIIETKACQIYGTKCEDSNTFDPILFKQLSEIKDISELSDAIFEFSNVYYFSPSSKVLPQYDSEMVKRVVMILVEQDVDIPGDRRMMQRLLKFSCPNEDQKEVWKSLFNDQFSWNKDIDEKKRKKQKDLEGASSSAVSLPSSKVDDKHHTKVLDKKTYPINSLSKSLQDVVDNPVVADEELFKEIEDRIVDDECKKAYVKAVNELEKTERAHLRCLTILKEVFLLPVIKIVNKVQVALINDVITQVDVMMNIHQSFLDTFVKSIVKCGVSELPQLGIEFIKNIQFLKMESKYTTSYNSYSSAMKEIGKESHAIKAQNKAKEVYIQKTNGYGEVKEVEFYLSSPIKRIAQYAELIRDMLRHVGKDFPDIDSLKKAYLDAKQSAKGVNQMKIQLEEGEKQLIVRKSILGEFTNELAVGRKFITYEIPSEWHYFFLFSDMLVETIPIKYEGKPIKESQAEVFSNLRKIKTIDELKVWEFEIKKEYIFSIDTCLEDQQVEQTCKNVIIIKITQIPHRFSCSTPLERDVWNSVIYDQLELLKQIEATKRNRKNDVIDFEISLHKKAMSSISSKVVRHSSPDSYQRMTKKKKEKTPRSDKEKKDEKKHHTSEKKHHTGDKKDINESKGSKIEHSKEHSKERSKEHSKEHHEGSKRDSKSDKKSLKSEGSKGSISVKK